MNRSTLLLLLFSGTLLLPLGCRRAQKADATRPLQESFQSATPEIQQTIQTVNASLKSGNYADATKALAPIVTSQDLTPPQKQAVGVALQQINQAVAANPTLDTKEMYELRARMFRAVDGGRRF